MKNPFSNWNFSLFSSSNRTKCKCDSNLADNNSTCSKAMKWLFSYFEEKDLDKMKEEYNKLVKTVDE